MHIYVTYDCVVNTDNNSHLYNGCEKEIHMKILSTICAVIFATSCFAQSIEISQAYALSPPPNAKTSAAYMIINNIGDVDLTLIGADTDYAKRAEIHGHSMSDDGIMKMSKVDELVIPAGECLMLGSGGYHIMLLGLTQMMTVGDILNLDLHFDEINSFNVEVKIDRQFVEVDEIPLPEGRETCIGAMDESKVEHYTNEMDHVDMDHSDR